MVIINGDRCGGECGVAWRETAGDRSCFGGILVTRSCVGLMW